MDGTDWTGHTISIAPDNGTFAPPRNISVICEGGVD